MNSTAVAWVWKVSSYIKPSMQRILITENAPWQDISEASMGRLAGCVCLAFVSIIKTVTVVFAHTL